VYLDKAGADQLVSAIQAAQRGDHQHLMTEQWGGRGLTVSNGSTRSFNKVTITFMPQT
jgi:catechol-2,3-dioxygenase